MLSPWVSSQHMIPLGRLSHYLIEVTMGLQSAAHRRLRVAGDEASYFDTAGRDTAIFTP